MGFLMSYFCITSGLVLWLTLLRWTSAGLGFLESFVSFIHILLFIFHFAELCLVNLSAAVTADVFFTIRWSTQCV
jgi:hypothetical protein